MHELLSEIRHQQDHADELWINSFRGNNISNHYMIHLQSHLKRNS